MKYKNLKQIIIKKFEKEGTYKKGMNVDVKELAAGIRVEMEHTSDKDIAQEIALDHLMEDPKYYTKLKKMETEDTMKKSKIALCILPGNLSKSHPAGLSAPGGKTKSSIPDASKTGHAERIKFAQMAAQRMVAGVKQVKASDLLSEKEVDRKGRVKGGKKPYSGYPTAVSGMGSQATDMVAKVTYVVKPSELAANGSQKAPSSGKIK